MGEEDTILEFGIKRENEERRDGGCAVVFNPKTQLFAVSEGIGTGFLRLFAGGVNPGENLQEGILREVMEESGLCDFLYVEKIGKAYAHYYNSLRKVNRVTETTCLLVILQSTDLVDVLHEEHEKFFLVWKSAAEIFDDWKIRNENKDLDHWVYFFNKAIKRLKELNYDKTSVLE